MDRELKYKNIIIFFWTLLIFFCVILYLGDLLYVASENKNVLFSLNTDEASHVELLMHAYREKEMLSIHSYGHLFFNISLLILEVIGQQLAIDDEMIIVVLRAVSVTSYFMAVFSTGLLANRVLTLGLSMISVLCFAVIPLDLVRYAFISHPDVLQIALLNFSILFFCGYLNKNSSRCLYISFAFCGLAFSTKYSGLFLIILYYMWMFASEKSLTYERYRFLSEPFLRIAGIVISTIGFYFLSEISIDVLVDIMGSRNTITIYHLDFLRSLVLLSKVTLAVIILVCLSDKVWSLFWRKIYNSSGASKAVYGSIIFFMSFAIFSPGLIPNFRFLRGMAAESVHVSFGHTFRDHGSSLEWLDVLYSEDLLGIPFGAFFTLCIFFVLYSAFYERKIDKEILFHLSWIVLIFIYCIFKVNYREPRYLLVVIPSLVVVSIFGAQNALSKFTFNGSNGKIVVRLCFFVIFSFVSLYGFHSFKNLKSRTLSLASEYRIEFFKNWLEKYCDSDVRVAYVPYVYVPSHYDASRWMWVWEKNELLSFSPDVVILSKAYIEDFTNTLKSDEYFFGKNAFISAKNAISYLNKKYSVSILLDGEYTVFHSKSKCKRDGMS